MKRFGGHAHRRGDQAPAPSFEFLRRLSL